MYTPSFNAVADEDEIRAMVASMRAGWLVTVDAEGFPMATLLPVIWHGRTVFAHMAKANPQWRQIAPDSPALVICSGPDAYISPSWYAAKQEHGRVVPTWNYTAVQLSGRVRTHQDPEWLRSVVTELTETHEALLPHPWQVTDAPDAFIDAQLNGIVGIELTVERFEGKAKLSQNRSEADRLGVIAGLRATAHDDLDAHAIAEAMAREINASGDRA
jgi:transcriptional regulator